VGHRPTIDKWYCDSDISALREFALLLFLPGLPDLSRSSLDISRSELFDLPVFVVCRRKAGVGQEEQPSWYMAHDSGLCCYCFISFRCACNIFSYYVKCLGNLVT